MVDLDGFGSIFVGFDIYFGSIENNLELCSASVGGRFIFTLVMDPGCVSQFTKSGIDWLMCWLQGRILLN